MPLAMSRPFELLFPAQASSPDVMIWGSTTWIHGTPGDWHGPYSQGFGIGGAAITSLLTDNNDRWMKVHQIAGDAEQAQTIVGSEPLSVQHLPTPPMPSPTTGARVGVYNKNNDSWMIAQNGNYYSSPDYGASWTAVGTEAGAGGGFDRHFAIDNTTTGRTEFYLVFGNGTRLTDDDGATWTRNDFTFSGVGSGPLCYRPTQDEIYCLCADGGLRWKPRSTWHIGPWNLDFGSGTPTGCVDVNPVSDVVVIGYQNGGTTNARTARKTGTGVGGIGGGFDFPGTPGQVVRQLRFLPQVAGNATWLAITSANELWVSTDDAVSFTKDTVTTLPATGGTLQMEHRSRNTFYTRT